MTNMIENLQQALATELTASRPAREHRGSLAAMYRFGIATVPLRMDVLPDEKTYSKTFLKFRHFRMFLPGMRRDAYTPSMAHLQRKCGAITNEFR